MNTFEQALRERLTKLDADYQRHRAALLAAIYCETGGAENEAEPVMDALKPGAPSGHVPASQSRSPSSPPDTEMHGVSEAYVKNQLEVVMDAIRQLPDGFNKDAVRAKLAGNEWRLKVTDNTLDNIASFLWRLHKDGRIKIQEKGQGHRQSVYVKM
jgi:hypothetical protein